MISLVFIILSCITYICKGCAAKLPKSTQPGWVGLVFRGWWVELDYEIFFNSGLGWDRVITITNPPNPTRPTYIFKFKLYIFKNI